MSPLEGTLEETLPQRVGDEHTHLEEETRQEVEAVREYELDWFEKNWKRPARRTCYREVYGKGQRTLLHNLRWWFVPCNRGGMPPLEWDGAISAWRKTVLAFANERFILSSVMIPCTRQSLHWIITTRWRLWLSHDRRRARRSYSSITSSSDEAPPQSARKLDLEVPANPCKADLVKLASQCPDPASPMSKQWIIGSWKADGCDVMATTCLGPHVTQHCSRKNRVPRALSCSPTWLSPLTNCPP